MALPNIFTGTTVLAPGEAGNKNQNWLCDGRTQFYWLRYAQQLQNENDARAPRVLAIATALQALDAKPAPTLHEEDPDNTAYWYDIVTRLAECNREMGEWDARFLEGKIEHPLSTYSPKQQKQLARMADQYLGERV